MIEYRVLDDIASFEEVVDLEITVWQLAPRDAVPSSLIHAVTISGGMLIGAFDGRRLAGMGFALPARRGKNWLLWSHMVGVHPDYQGQGIGVALKQMQRLWALQHGYDTIAWTFDPLQRGNANLNLHLLGASANTYHVNFYGDMTDGINIGLPSDRLEITWQLKDKRVTALMADNPPTPLVKDYPDNWFLLCSDTSGAPRLNDLDISAPYLFAEVPFDLSRLKRSHPEQAYAWRLAQRQALQAAFGSGYSAVDFVSTEDRAFYVLRAPQSWFMYVLQCSDATLYAGITVDIDRRAAQHNAGRGAAYTASRRPVKVVAVWRYPDRSAALKAESAFKKLGRLKKQQLIEGRAEYRDAPFIDCASLSNLTE
jgi:predicted GNAT superfamily acetyltransferase